MDRKRSREIEKEVGVEEEEERRNVVVAQSKAKTNNKVFTDTDKL